MSDSIDFSSDDKAALLALADKGSFKLYNMSFNALLEKVTSSDKSMDKATLFMSMVLAGYTDSAPAAEPDASSSSAVL